MDAHRRGRSAGRMPGSDSAGEILGRATTDRLRALWSRTSHHRPSRSASPSQRARTRAWSPTVNMSIKETGPGPSAWTSRLSDSTRIMGRPRAAQASVTSRVSRANFPVPGVISRRYGRRRPGLDAARRRCARTAPCTWRTTPAAIARRPCRRSSPSPGWSRSWSLGPPGGVRRQEVFRVNADDLPVGRQPRLVGSLHGPTRSR